MCISKYGNPQNIHTFTTKKSIYHIEPISKTGFPPLKKAPQGPIFSPKIFIIFIFYLIISQILIPIFRPIFHHDIHYTQHVSSYSFLSVFAHQKKKIHWKTFHFSFQHNTSKWFCFSVLVYNKCEKNILRFIIFFLPVHKPWMDIILRSAASWR